MNKPPAPEIQKKIYDFISKNPGVYLSKIAEILNTPISSVEYHILYMKRNRIITIVNEAGYERYYIKKRTAGIQDKRILEIRERIYYLIKKNPGLHLSKIAEILNIRTSLAEYHLNYLVKNKLIIAIKEGSYYKRYYIEGSEVGDKDKKVIAILRREIPLKIVLFLLKSSNSKYKEIQKNLDMSAPNLSYHLNKLVENGIVNVPTLDVKGYSIRNKREIIRFLKKYKIHTITEGFKDMWVDLDYYDR